MRPSGVLAVLLICLGTAGSLAARQSVSPVTQTIPSNLTAPAPPQTGTGLVTGQVVDARGAAVPDAIVMIQGGYRAIALTTDNREIPGGPRHTMTNRDGRFAFFNLTPGSYAFDANKAGFVAGAYGRIRPGGAPQSIELKDGERLTGIRITMWEYASATGTVRDEAGEPVVGVFVRAMRRASVFGRWLWVSASGGTTNDRGQYRIDGLLPGAYVVLAASTVAAIPMPAAAPGSPAASQDLQLQIMRAGMSQATGSRVLGNWLWGSGRSALVVPDPADDGRISVYPTTFFPGARSTREAEKILLESGQERGGVDLQLQLVPSTFVSGVLIGPDGPAAGQSVRLAPDYADELGPDVRSLETATTVTDASGTFFFAGVPAGTYFVQCEMFTQVGPTGQPVQAGRTGTANERLTVREDGMANLTITLKPTVKVSGQIAFDGTKPPPPPDLISRFTVSLETIGFAVNMIEAPYSAIMDRNGQFTILNVPPGQYVATFRAALVDRRAMPDWETKGITLNGKDISDHPFTVSDDVSGVTVSLTDHNTQLSGKVRGTDGKPDPNAAVLMFTTERELWTVRMVRRIRILRASESGDYSVRGVPPGQYFLVAIPDSDVGDYPDPGMLESLSKLATTFVMSLGERKAVDLITRDIK